MIASISRPDRFVLDGQQPAFVLIGMMRSGSNFLERRLNELPELRCHGELFNPGFIGFASAFGQRCLSFRRDDVGPRDADALGFLRQIMAARDRPICGFRFFMDHSASVLSEVIHNPAVKKVVLTRNLLDAYVSLEIARQTNVWLSTEEAPPDQVRRVVVQPGDLVRFALRQTLFYNDVLTALNRTGQTHFHIDYAEIKSLSRLNALLTFLGVTQRFETDTEPLKRQNPGAQRDKISNYTQVVKALKTHQLDGWFL